MIHRVRSALSACGMSLVCVACPEWVSLVVSGCSMSSVGMVVPQLRWHVSNRCAYVLSWCVYGLTRCGVASVGLSMTQRWWHVLSGPGMAPRCDITSMGVAWLSGCGMASVAVA